jgi:hypothetical protein
LLWTRVAATAAHALFIIAVFLALIGVCAIYAALWRVDNKLWAGVATAAIGAFAGYWYAKQK